MSPEELEKMLRAAPTQGLSAAAERRILQAVLSAGAGRRHWWARPVPLWQTLTACAAITLCALAWGASGQPATTTPAPPGTVAHEPLTAFVPVEAPLLGLKLRPAYRTDIAGWSQLDLNLNGVPRP